MNPNVAVPLWVWGVFMAGLLALLMIDLIAFSRSEVSLSTRRAAKWVGIWVALAAVFGIGMYFVQGPTSAAEFATGYVVEWALSVDNMFVFALVFSYFRLPAEHQHRVLFWGILGALVFRLAFIFLGAVLLSRFDWIIFVFGAFLVVTGIKMAISHGVPDVDPEDNVVLKLVRKLVPMSSTYDGDKFFVRNAGKLYATPMLAVLIAVETTDIVFAVDSIPAIFGVTKDPFIVFTSNAFAILGLRSLYFLLVGMIDKFKYLSMGLAAVLVFIGAKMLLERYVHVPILVSLGVIALLLGSAVVASLMSKDEPPESVSELLPPAPPPPLSD